MHRLIMVVLLLTATPTLAEEVSDYDRFRLWHACLPMDLVVEDLNEEAAAIGLTRETITIAVRSRLRAARLYDADASSSYLYVNVNVVNPAYSINFAYRRLLESPLTGEIGLATTWNSGSTGTHGMDSGYILSNVSRHVDRFIDEYLRVNVDACQ